MENKNIPQWLLSLEDEDYTFIKRFVLSSGSLKEIAKEYQVSYPTVRLRLDRLIEKIKIRDKEEIPPFVKLVKDLALDDKLDFDTAKILINAYKKEKNDV